VKKDYVFKMVLTNTILKIIVWVCPGSSRRNTDSVLKNTGGVMEAMRILRLRDVVHLTGLSRSTVYSLIQNEKFPKPLRLSARASGWLLGEVEEWINSCREGGKKC
jgi:prophage regulatory protein